MGEAQDKVEELDAYLKPILNSEYLDESARLRIITSNLLVTSAFKRDNKAFAYMTTNSLIQNISKAKSPALSMDFLVSIYLYSDYLPQHSLPHHKALTLPVIFERIWLLYLSHYRQISQSCDHIFASCLTVDSFAKQMASEYFLTLSQSPYILHVYNTYDRCG